MELFKYLDYQKYLLAVIETHTHIKGYQRQLADAAKCQQSYFSQMLRGNVNLSVEQGFRVAVFLNLSSNEIDYFLELIHFAKTDYPQLKNRIKEKLKLMRKNHENLAKRFQETIGLSNEKQQLYYSSWYWSAIHILAGISEYQTIEAIAGRLQLPRDLVQSCLISLASMGLVKANGSKWVIVPGHVHISSDSPLNSTNHMNWRYKANIDTLSRKTDGLHYTIVQSHSDYDFQQIKDILLSAMDKARDIMRPSKDEELSCMCLDFFRV